MVRAALIVAAALLLAATVAVAKRGPTWDKLDGYTFERYVADFGKTYSETEAAERKAIFEQRLQEVRLHNAVSFVTYKKGINHMSDWTDAERRRLLGRVSDNMVATVSEPARVLSATGAELPGSVDWRKHFPPVVTAVKDQGQCGSCWSHGAAEAIESQYALQTGELYVLSQQQLVSCVDNSVLQCGGTGGCNGATVEVAWDYVKSVNGITQEWNYGYSSYWGEVAECQFVNNQTGPTPAEVYVNNYTLVARNNDTATAEAVALHGPMAISVQADTWQDYESGVFTNCSYNISMDHAVLLVGYGTDTATNMDYWLVRNSWSGDWGEQGYIRLARNKANEECGWNNDWTTAGGGCKGDPNTIWACGMCGILYDVVFPNVTAARDMPAASGSDSKSKAWIAGPVVGGVVVLAIIIAVVMKAKKPSGYNNIQDRQDLLERP